MHMVLALASIVVPALLFAVSVASDYARALAAGRERVERTSVILRENALKVLQTQRLVLARVEDALARGPDGEDLGQRARSAIARAMDDAIEDTVSMWVADSEGRLIAGSQGWEPQMRIDQNEWFVALRERDQSLYISAPFVGRATGVLSVALARRRPAPDGEFAGTVHLSVNPAYFAQFFAGVAGHEGHHAMLLRADGQVLAEDPPRGGYPKLDADDPLMRRLAVGSEGGLIEEAGSAARLIGYQRIGEFPVYVSFALDRDAVLAEWRARTAEYFLVALACTIALACAAIFAMRENRARLAALVALEEEIAQREATEQRLRENSRLEAVGRVTGGIAHDFNNLLTTMLMSLDMIEAGPASDAERAALVRHARRAAETGAGLVASLLAYARGQMLAPTPLDAAVLVSEVIPLLRQSAGEGMAIELTAEDGLPPCLADPVQLRSALFNLALNARDAMAGGGRLRIGLSRHTLDADDLAGNPDAASGNFIAIEFTDQGEGIAAEDLPRVFEPFFTTKAPGKGTGLGLSQVFGFVRQSHGHVRIESAVGIGTTVTVFLPVAEQPAAETSAGQAEPPAPALAQAPRPPGATPRVLVVDDNAEILGLARSILRAGKFEVVTASSGDEAARMLDAGAPCDVLLSDVLMPGTLDGFALAERAARVRPSLPVVLMSGYAPEPDRVPASVAAFLQKPFNRDSLRGTVQAALSREVA